MNKRIRSGTLLAAFGVMLLVAACGPAATPTPANSINSIQGTVWQWVSVTNQSTGEETSVRNPENYTITFNADGDFTVVAKGKVSIKSTQDMSLEANAKASVKGTAGLSLDGTSQAELKAAQVSVNGSGMTEVKGGIVKIN